MEQEADHGEASEVHRRVQDTKERWKEVCSFDFEALITELVGSAPDSNFLCRLLQLRQNASDVAQGCADFSSNSTDRNHSFTPNPRRASPSLRPDLSFRYTQPVGGQQKFIMLSRFSGAVKIVFGVSACKAAVGMSVRA